MNKHFNSMFSNNQILDKKCTGCSACYNICPQNAIVMKESHEGFLYPEVDESKCINCGLCEKVCPVLKIQVKNDYKKEVYAVTASDEIRYNSSSGGVFTLLANCFLDLGGYVCGASFSEDFKKVAHIIISNKDDLYKLQKSKYLQSDIGIIYKQIKELLDKNNYVFFTGTPCQVAGLNNYLLKSYDKLLTADILCHGVPSPMVWRDYLEEISQGKKVKSVNFRDKSKGWKPPLTFSIEKDKENIQYNISDNIPYFKAFLENLILRKSCSNCKFMNLNRVSDITIGDFWGIHKFNKKLDDNKGVSMVMLNTHKGKSYLEKINDKLQLVKKIPLKVAVSGNPVLSRTLESHKQREDFFKKYSKDKVSKLMKMELGGNQTYDGVISNFWYTANNYGALLTAYAIQQIFRNKKLDYRLLNYDPLENKKGAKESFANNFVTKYLYLTEKYTNIRDLKSLNQKTNNFVIGSDQVFRDYYIRKYSDIAFFTFTDFSKKRVAFSASFGYDDIKTGQENIPYYKRFVKRFDAISIRESSGVDFCKRIYGLDTVHIIDPVFLVDRTVFENLIIANDEKYKNKIVTYVLDATPEFLNKVEMLSKELGLEVVDLAYTNVSVEEFVTAIKNAKYFITDSFHGACFSLLFHTSFLALINKDRGSARFDSLIKTFGISQNFVGDINQFDSELLKNQRNDWNYFESIILKEKQKFENWYKEVFETEKTVTQEQIINEFDFMKYPRIKNNIFKVLFNNGLLKYESLGERKILTILGIKLKFKIK